MLITKFRSTSWTWVKEFLTQRFKIQKKIENSSTQKTKILFIKGRSTLKNETRKEKTRKSEKHTCRVFQESWEKNFWRKEVAICVQFYWEAYLEEHSKMCVGFKDTKNTGEEPVSTKQEETQGSAWTTYSSPSRKCCTFLNTQNAMALANSYFSSNI